YIGAWQGSFQEMRHISYGSGFIGPVRGGAGTEMAPGMGSIGEASFEREAKHEPTVDRPRCPIARPFQREERIGSADNAARSNQPRRLPARRMTKPAEGGMKRWTDTGNFRNPHYHGPSDTPDTLDYAFIDACPSCCARSSRRAAERLPLRGRRIRAAP